ncbi:MAG: M14 family zinc carboxypeptidase [bacterium]
MHLPRVLLLFVILLTAATAVAADYMQVRILIESRDDIARLSGLALDPVSRGDDYLEVITNDQQLAEIKSRGLRVEVIQSDLKAFYRSRLDQSKTMGGYMTLAEVNAAFDALIADHPDIVSAKVNLGNTHEGRPMWAAKISDNPNVDEDEPEVMITAAIHAREVITPLVLLNTMDYLTSNCGSDPEVTDLVNNREIWFVPIVNPDGYYRNQVTDPGGGGMWRKNRRNNGDGTWGVDLNRNFGYEWGYDDDGSSPYTGDETYRGPSAFSEPETQHMRDFTIAHEFVSTVYMHSYSNLVLWPWGYDQVLTPENDLFEIMGDSMAAYNGYTPEPSHGLYNANGVTDDWGYGEQTLKNKNYAFTIEIGSGFDGFWPDTSRIPELIAENLGALLFVARTADNPHALLPPATPVIFVADTVDAAAYEVSWAVSDSVNPAVLYELIELSGWDRVTDPANDFMSWANNEFSVSSARSHSAPTSFYSGSGNNFNRWIQTTNSISVSMNDSLSVWMWYDIESDWDYAYVEVSTDGSTFSPIPGNVTTNSNPNGTNRGNGITGQSGGWVQGLFDLSIFAPHSVWIRLSYVTDSYVDEEGIYFDDIFPVESFSFMTIVGSNLTDTSYLFEDHLTGDYWYKVRARDDDGQWSGFSSVAATVVIEGEEVCYDTDGDGYGDPDHPENTCPDDNCPTVYNDDQLDSDGDEIGDVCDVCPNDPDNDIDADGVCGDVDNCPAVYNPDQTSSGGLAEGDACCCLVRGDINHDGEINIQDLVGLVNYMFQSGLAALCPMEAEIDGNGVGPDIADLVYLVAYMFSSGPPPPACS